MRLRRKKGIPIKIKLIKTNYNQGLTFKAEDGTEFFIPLHIFELYVQDNCVEKGLRKNYEKAKQQARDGKKLEKTLELLRKGQII